MPLLGASLVHLASRSLGLCCLGFFFLSHGVANTEYPVIVIVQQNSFNAVAANFLSAGLKKVKGSISAPRVNGE